MAPPTYTYDRTTLATEPVHRVRRIIGDIDVAAGDERAYFSDEEITYTISAVPTEMHAAVELLEQLATLYADRATVATGAQRLNLSDISKRYEQRAAQLKARAGITDAGDEINGLQSITKVDGYSQNIRSDAVTTDETDPDGWVEQYIGIPG